MSSRSENKRKANLETHEHLIIGHERHNIVFSFEWFRVMTQLSFLCSCFHCFLSMNRNLYPKSVVSAQHETQPLSSILMIISRTFCKRSHYNPNPLFLLGNLNIWLVLLGRNYRYFCILFCYKTIEKPLISNLKLTNCA